ncbi:hypothetical protein [Streptomyces sp. NPDC005017]|uniref:hypothetical protein n=1 Tax=Streptomyces sp. NPDC005017 TaxID=3364706 RepID=UPI0036787237
MTAETPPPPAEEPAFRPGPQEPGHAHPVLAAVAGAVIGAGAVGVSWTFAGGGEGPAGPPPTLASWAPTAFTLTGTFELTDGAVGDGAGGCRGEGGYDDIFEGTAVTVYDAAGTVVATGHLGESMPEGGACRFDVSVADVPTGERFYLVRVSHRGTVLLTEAQAAAGGFGATLG